MGRARSPTTSRTGWCRRSEVAADREREVDVRSQGQLMTRASRAASGLQLKSIRAANFDERVLVNTSTHKPGSIDTYLHKPVIIIKF